MIPFPDKKYQIIYADPPWSYKDKMTMKGVHGMIKGVANFYKTMSYNDIKKLPVKNIADENCILFLWVTMPLIQEGIEVIKSWGFEYKTCGFTWVKRTKLGKIHYGMGHYTRGNAELCLIGLKGKIEIMSHSVSQVVESKIRKHSKKPNVVREKIVELCGNLFRIELFARRPKGQLFEDSSFKGWDLWGDEI